MQLTNIESILTRRIVVSGYDPVTGLVIPGGVAEWFDGVWAWVIVQHQNVSPSDVCTCVIVQYQNVSPSDVCTWVIVQYQSVSPSDLCTWITVQYQNVFTDLHSTSSHYDTTLPRHPEPPILGTARCEADFRSNYQRVVFPVQSAVCVNGTKDLQNSQ